MEECKVLIPTSGVGSRLGDLSKYTNKSLVKVGDKAVISHIIDLYSDREIVITLGYFGEYVKQYLLLAHPNVRFEFVYVTHYAGDGSSLLKSMACAKDKLQCPFIFHVCDTILVTQPPPPEYNWMACGISPQSDIFRTVITRDDTIIKVNDKGAIHYDYAYAGVAGILDYKKFWNRLEDILSTKKKDLSDCHVFDEMASDTTIKVFKLEKWFDTGSVENLYRTRSHYKQKYNVLDKKEEAIYFVDDSVIKFFSDTTLCQNRIKRAKLLHGLVPKIVDSSINFYKYKLVEGKLLSNIISDRLVQDLIDWADNNLWSKVPIDPHYFKIKCKEFYITKTIERLSSMFIEDKVDIINGIKVPTCKEMMHLINWDTICSTEPVRFHGDFIPDNILYDGHFTLIDWRQDFAGEIEVGDKYYDLAKLNHNLIVNHAIVAKNLFSIVDINDEITCDIYRSHNMVVCQEFLLSLLEKRGYDVYKIRIITALIWLNMSPLHDYVFGKFLFYFGKYNLWKWICEM